MSEIFLVLLGAVFVNNLIVEELVGTDPALESMHRMDLCKDVSIAMLCLLPVITVTTQCVDDYLLVPFNIEYLALLVFVMLIVLVSLVLKHVLPLLNNKLAQHTVAYLPMLAINTAVLGTVLLNQQAGHGIVLSFFYGLGTAAGFGLVLIILTSINETISVQDVPAPFRGMPLTLITLGFISMSFLGFSGLT